MDSPPADVSIWNTVQELVSLEKDVYGMQSRHREEETRSNNNDAIAWRTGYREHLRWKALKRQQLLESLERGLKSCDWDTLRGQIRTKSLSAVYSSHGKQDNETGNELWKQQPEVTNKREQKQMAESSKREFDSVACKLEFEPNVDKLEESSTASKSCVRSLNDQPVDNLQRDYIQLQQQYHTVLAEKEALEQTCSSLENLIQMQRKRMEYYEKELEDMTKCFSRKAKITIDDESNKENQTSDDNKYICTGGDNARRPLKDTTETVQQQQRQQLALVTLEKEELEQTVERLSSSKRELETEIRRLREEIEKLERKKQISLDSLHSMFQQIHTEVARFTQNKYQVTHLANDVLLNCGLSSYDGKYENAQVEPVMDTHSVTLKALAKLQDKVCTLQDALAQSQEEAKRYKKSLFALREEHEMTIQRYGKEFQLLCQELHRLRNNKKKKQSHCHKPTLSFLR